MNDTMTRRRRPAILTSMALAVAMGGIGVITTPVTAQAAPIKAIQTVNIVQTKAGSFDQVKVDVTWRLPAGVGAGDTWTLALPKELDALSGTTFPLKASDGQVLANAVINGDVVTFTTTAAAANFQNLTGTAYFYAGRNKDAATNVVLPVTFVDNTGTTFDDTIQFDGLPGTNTSNETYKWGAAASTSRLRWGILAPRPSALGQEIIFTEQVPEGAGFEINCGTSMVTLWGHAMGMNNGEMRWMADNSKPAGFNGFEMVECSPTKMVAKLTVTTAWPTTPTGAFFQPEVRMESVVVTDSTVPYWRNSGSVTLFGDRVIPVSSWIANPAAGGDASGDLVTVQKYTRDLATGDHDTAPGLLVGRDQPVPVTMVVSNDGLHSLTDVVIKDSTEAGPDITDMSCTFPDGRTVRADAAQTVTWDGTLAVGGEVTCTGTLPALAAGARHADTVTVTARGNGPVTASDPFHVTSSAVPAVSVGDYVFHDVDRDGVQDGTDRPMEGVTLTLTGPDGAPVTDVFGDPVTTTKTDADGKYSFDDLPTLPAGQHYTVTVTPPSGYTPTTPGAGTREDDSSTGSASSTDLTQDGQRDASLDFGFYQTPVTPPEPEPEVSVGDYVWFDADKDGIQDSTEKGIAGATLTLTGPDGKAVTDVDGNPVGPTRTDADGRYSFDKLPVLPEGQHYTVTITPPAGYVPTRPGVGGRETDSSTTTAVSVDLTTDGARDDTLDFGFVRPSVSVGDYVWFDADKDGVQDRGEKGIAGVTLTLVGPDGKAVTDVHGDPVKPVRTDGNGRYSFENLPTLPEGSSYTVRVTAPKGYTATKAGAGSNRAVDSSTGSARSIDLTTDGQRDATLDFGFYLTPKTVTFRVQVDDWRLKNSTQARTTNAVVKDGLYRYREDVRWSTRTGRVASAPLWAKGVSTWSVKTMSVKVDPKATPAQVLAAQKQAAAKKYGVKVGAKPGARVGKTYRSVWIVQDGSWDSKTSWKVGAKTKPQVLVGAHVR